MNESHPEHGITTGAAGAHPEHGITIPAGPGGQVLHFSEAEWQSFRESDMGAGRAVVILMACIFIVGLCLYATIDYLIW